MAEFCRIWGNFVPVWVKSRGRQKVERQKIRKARRRFRENENKIFTNSLWTRKIKKSKLVTSKWENIRNTRNSVLQQQEHFLSYRAQPPTLML